MADRRSATLPFIGVIFVVLAVGLTLIALTSEREERRVRDGSLRTTATVVRPIGRGVLVRFATAGGDRLDVTVPVSRLSPHGEGETVPIYYHSDNPAFAGLDDPITRWFRTASAAALALVSVIIGAALLRASQRP